LAVDIEPFGDLEAPAARHQGGRRFEEEIVEVVTDLLSHLDDVAEALGRDQADGGAGAFDHRIGHQCGAVHDAVQVRCGETGLTQQPPRAVDDRLARIVRRRQELAGVNEIAPGIVQHEIGECASDIDPEARRRPHAHFDP
jgi:hypothetical protein